ncbi:4-(cytidine 5'-diphospho)-2-C-methyl-D-erythritol kinase [Corynebacterium sp. HMSC074E01]|uniref:4-(cytidine 5'-diphospho)-2-C-methyl-D-erythritol kinase n=1 Tax=Corynebacterium sp. HMSC074E01 TaxID=1715017 RepID=UPI0008A3B00D|nr:4-(cytidine 5'-diphospho)-2-C-methyl-D-erythritol kinase [Corynebacterium sp. HMSC074E01]OFN75911.1 4-(cytidine 5'-diphospho)-2-C-methyl-D-erythritol kinase [Corynebacterium sp. HMSC074E01]
MSKPVNDSPQLWQARAHAKVNLHLGVGEARADGFHELATVFQSLDVHDRVSYRWGEGSTVEVTGNHAKGVPASTENLAWRAVELVAQNLMLPAAGKLTMEKNIPAAGGMAGGSADAAAALLLANQALSSEFSREALSMEKLYELAAELGSDVPFTLMGGTALGRGRGELLTPMLSRGRYIWAIITNAEGLSTPSVFRKLDELRTAGRGSAPHLDTEVVGQALVGGNPRELAAVMHNDLQPAALSLRPDLRKILDTGEAAGALKGIVSGSGPTCAFLCEDEEIAQEVVAQVCADNRGTRGLVTRGPTTGVTLV